MTLILTISLPSLRIESVSIDLMDKLREHYSGGFTLGGRDSKGSAIDLKLSVGVAVFPRHAERPERLLWCADMALLEAKREGGNRFVLCDPTRIQRGAAL